MLRSLPKKSNCNGNDIISNALLSNSKNSCKLYLNYIKIYCILRFQINELQIYVSNRNEILRAKSCPDKNADRTNVKEGPRISLEKKNISSSTPENADNRQRFPKKTALADKRASRMRSSDSRFARGEYRTRRKSRRKWGRWMDWSSCSVTCGKGRQIRWRHCLHDCNDAETEMEEKACQLPACPPSKFLGIF